MGQFLFRIFLAQLVHPLWYPLKFSKVLFAGIRRSFKQQFDRQCFQDGTHRIKDLWQKKSEGETKTTLKGLAMHSFSQAFLLCTARKNEKRKLFRIINIVFVVGNRDTRWIDAGAKGVFFFLLKVTSHCDFRIKNRLA